MYLSDGAWHKWPESMYYDYTIRNWSYWHNSWFGLCAYKEEWFLWPQGQIFNIDAMRWENECAGDHFQTRYTLQANLSTISICRPLMYYVNPDSEEIMELGTKEYPFRDINVVFIEINNEHQHTDRNISIFVMEDTDHYLPLEFIKFLNITKISIDTYTEAELSDAKRSNFRTINTINDINDSKSLFNIVQNNKQITSDTSRMNEHELNEFSFKESVVFHIHRSSFNINSINVYTESMDISGIIYFYTSYWFQKTHRIYNLYTDIRGETYLNVYATTNIIAENITMNMTQSTGGFWYSSYCNFEDKLNLAEHSYK